MSVDPYSKPVRELFAHPTHVGDVPRGNSVAADEQGTHVRLSAAHDQGIIRALRFRANGCPHVIAACEFICSSFEGHPVAELAAFQAADIMRKLSVPVEKTGRILVIEDVVRSLERSIRDEAATGTQ